LSSSTSFPVDYSLTLPFDATGLVSVRDAQAPSTWSPRLLNVLWWHLIILSWLPHLISLTYKKVSFHTHLAEVPHNDKVNSPLQNFGSPIWGLVYVTAQVLEVWGGS